MPDNEMSAEEVSKWILHNLETEEVQSLFGGKRIPKPLTADWWEALNELLQVALAVAQERGRREGLDEAAKVAETWITDGPGWRLQDRIAAEIRSCLTRKDSE